MHIPEPTKQEGVPEVEQQQTQLAVTLLPYTNKQTQGSCISLSWATATRWHPHTNPPTQRSLPMHIPMLHAPLHRHAHTHAYIQAQPHPSRHRPSNMSAQHPRYTLTSLSFARDRCLAQHTHIHTGWACYSMHSERRLPSVT